MTAARKALGAGGSRRCTWRHLILSGCLGCLAFLLRGAVVGPGRLGFLGQAGSRGTVAVPGAAGSLRAPSPLSPPALLSRPCSSRPAGAICHRPGIPGVPGRERSRDAGNGSGRRQLCASSTPAGREGRRGARRSSSSQPHGVRMQAPGLAATVHPCCYLPRRTKQRCRDGGTATGAGGREPGHRQQWPSPPSPLLCLGFGFRWAWCPISPLSQAGMKINENK